MLTTNRNVIPATVRVGSTVLVRPGFNNDFIPVEVKVLELIEGNNGQGFTYVYPGADTPSWAYFTQVVKVLNF